MTPPQDAIKLAGAASSSTPCPLHIRPPPPVLAAFYGFNLSELVGAQSPAVRLE